MTVNTYDLRTLDGLTGHVFDASEIFEGKRGALMVVGIGRPFDLTARPAKDLRINQGTVYDGHTWTAQVWVAAGRSRIYQTTTSTEIKTTTTTLVISDGHTPFGVGFTTRDGRHGQMGKTNVLAGFPGLHDWLAGRGPHRNPPWEHLCLIHQVLAGRQGNGLLRQSLQAASLGIADPELAFLSWRSGADLTRVPPPPAGVDQKVWTVRWVGWVDHLHTLFANWITLDEISQPHIDDHLSRRPQVNLAALTRAEWDKLGDRPARLAASWAALAPDPATVPAKWIFDRANLRVAFAYPPEFAIEAQAAGWTPTHTGTFFRFHLDFCQGCDTRHSVDRWGFFPPDQHTQKESVLTGLHTLGLLGWAPIMSAHLAATHLAAGITVAEAVKAPMSLETARVAATLNNKAVPVFAPPTK